MGRNFNRAVTQFTMIAPHERKLVGWAFLYFFSLLSGYFILRPVRDEMGIINGAANMQWLFTGTFVVMLFIVPVFGYLTMKNTIKNVLVRSYIFFILNILLFYVLFGIYGKSQPLAITFFIWLSVFNLFAVSLFWSFMVDIFSGKASKRLFGIIAAGGSTGALTGPLLSSYIASRLAVEHLLLAAALFLLIALLSITRIIALKKTGRAEKRNNVSFHNGVIKENIWRSIKKIFTSGYLLGIILFVLLYTSTSTFLYFEQAHIIEDKIKASGDRIVYFANVDLITNICAITGQFLLTNRVIKWLGLAVTLALIPFIVGLGLTVVSFNVTLPVITTAMIIHRAGNFSFLRPGREMLFTVSSREEKYRAKNFIDTVMYRGGDAVTGWLFAGFLSLGLGLSAIALIAVPITALWGITGYKLGKKQRIKEKELNFNRNTYDSF